VIFFTVWRQISHKTLKNIPPVTENAFNKAFMSNESYNLLDFDDTYSIMKNGRGSGKITGGNLSLVVATLGTDHEINTDGKILFAFNPTEEIIKSIEETNVKTEKSPYIDAQIKEVKNDKAHKEIRIYKNRTFLITNYSFTFPELEETFETFKGELAILSEFKEKKDYIAYVSTLNYCVSDILETFVANIDYYQNCILNDEAQKKNLF